MTNKFHQGMTRTKSPSRDKSPLQLLGLILLCASVSLTLGWALFSPFEDSGGQQAQAQTTEPEPPSSSQDDSASEADDSSYAAFGESKDPFAVVVQQANEGDAGSGSAESGDGSATGEGSGPQTPPDENGARERASDQEADRDAERGGEPVSTEDSNDSLEDGSDKQAASPSRSNANGGSTGGAAGGSGGVNCQNPADEFEALLCEEGDPGARGGEAVRPGGTGDLDDDRDGGSGRSGAGEPTETFRNGGPAPGK